jgi:hypothetical protein
MGEHGQKPSLCVGLPAVDDREQRDRACTRSWLARGRSLDRLQLAAGRAVDDFPTAFTQLLAQPVGSLEVAGSTELDALLEDFLRFGPIRSSWL